MKIMASLALMALLCVVASSPPVMAAAAVSSPTYYDVTKLADGTRTVNTLLQDLAVTDNYEADEKNDQLAQNQQQLERLLHQNDHDNNSNNINNNNNNNAPKQSYNKRRRIKGDTPKRRTLANGFLPDDEELEQFLRYLQFSVPVGTRVPCSFSLLSLEILLHFLLISCHPCVL